MRTGSVVLHHVLRLFCGCLCVLQSTLTSYSWRCIKGGFTFESSRDRRVEQKYG